VDPTKEVEPIRSESVRGHQKYFVRTKEIVGKSFASYEMSGKVGMIKIKQYFPR
jgi:hypothetical protein